MKSNFRLFIKVLVKHVEKNHEEGTLSERM